MIRRTRYFNIAVRVVPAGASKRYNASACVRGPLYGRGRGCGFANGEASPRLAVRKALIELSQQLGMRRSR